jgi:hypothetical protein
MRGVLYWSSISFSVLEKEETQMGIGPFTTFLLAVALATAGCTKSVSESGTQNNAPAIADAKPAQLDPVAQLKAHIDHLQKAYPRMDKDDRREIFEISYDVKRTDSLVSPYTGLITFTERVRNTARSDVADGDFAKVLELVYQEGQWVLTGIKSRPRDGETWGTPWMNEDPVEVEVPGDDPDYYRKKYIAELGLQ